jgi:DNA-binding transcriptional ArsR family regulator
MPDTPNIAFIAALVADPTRAKMLALLMDGRAQTATELALEGGVTPSTASSHLARLTGAGLLTIASQGRHRYFRIAGADVARAIEGLMNIAPHSRARGALPGPRNQAMRLARVCYDHLAGEEGVRLLDRLRLEKLIAGDDDSLTLTARGEAWCGRIGVDLGALRATRRRLCRQCLDWSERRAHLAGALGAALLDRLFELRYARREPESRTVVLSPRGRSFVESLELAR